MDLRQSLRTAANGPLRSTPALPLSKHPSRLTFFYNGTNNALENLVIKHVEDKNYQNEGDLPLWGIEDWFYTLDQMQLICGIVDPALEGFQNVSTIRAPSLYMIGSGSGFGEVLDTLRPSMNPPVSIVPIGAMHTIATFSSSTSTSVLPFDFTAQIA